MTGRRSSLKSVLLLSAGSFAHLVLQFLLLKVLADQYGSGAEIDAYSVARAVPLVAGTILIGTLNFAFVPIFIERREKLGPEAAWRTAGAVGGLMFLVTTSLSLLAFFAARPIIAFLNPGFSAEQAELAVQLFRILIWLLVTTGATSFLQALHHCEQRFLAPALSPGLSAAVAVTMTVLLHERLGIAAAAYGVLTGAALGVTIQLPLFLRHARLSLTADDGLLRVLRMMTPLVIGAAYYKLDPLIDRYLLSDETGSIAWLEYSWQFSSAMLTLTVSGLSVVVFPVIAAHSSTGNREGLKQELSYAMRFLAFLLTPIVFGLLFFSTPVIRDLFEGGKFEPEDTLAVSRLIKIYLAMIVGGAFGEMLARVYYVLQDTMTPVKIGAVGFTLGVIAKFLTSDYGVISIAAATSGYYLFNAGLMLLLLRKRIEGTGFLGVLRTVGQSLIGTAAASAVAYLILLFEFRLCSILAAILAAASYAVVMALLGNEFATGMFQYLRNLFTKNSTDQP